MHFGSAFFWFKDPLFCCFINKKIRLCLLNLYASLYMTRKGLALDIFFLWLLYILCGTPYMTPPFMTPWGPGGSKGGSYRGRGVVLPSPRHK